MKKIRILALLMLVAVLLSFPFAAQAKDWEFVEATKHIIVNDTTIVVEFSEPLALDMNQKSVGGPWIDVRLVKNGSIRYIDDVPVQWLCNTYWADENQDRMVIQMYSNGWGCDTIPEILNFEGELAKYKDQGWYAVVNIEERPADTSRPSTDGVVSNITDQTGEKYLRPTYPQGREGVQFKLSLDDYNWGYDVDLDNLVGFETTGQKWDFNIMAKIDPVGEDAIETEPAVTTVVKNDPLVIAVILGAGVLTAVVLSVVCILTTRKKKGGERS